MPEARMRIAMLGPLEVAVAERVVTGFHSDKARALLAYLCHEARPIERDALCALLWPSSPQDKARGSLRVALTNVRKIAGTRIAADRKTVRFHAAPGDEIDAVRVAAWSESADGAAAARAAARYRGVFLADLRLDDAPDFEAWRQNEGARFARMASEAFRAHAADAEARGEATEAVAILRRLVAIDPLDEAAQRRLMRALALADDTTAALRAYEALRESLQRELDVAPDAATLALRERILDRRARGSSAAPSTDRTPFVGREAELARIANWLRMPERPVITLLGPGGMGKTRLALEVARRQTSARLDGALVVPLADLRPDESVAAAVLAALGLPPAEPAAAEARLIDALTDREMLLVLDNFEYLSEQASLCTQILARAPEVRIVVTSRQVLGLPGEQQLPLAGLDHPGDPAVGVEVGSREDRFGGGGLGPGERGRGVEGPSELDDARDPQRTPFAAEALFVAAARRTRPDFDPQAEADAVSTIARHVEGMPLALELAAGWLESQSCRAIADAVRADPDALRAAPGERTPRHASIRAVFDRSWDALDGDDRLAFARLCVFRGGFDDVAAREVARADASALRQLVRASLVRRAASDRYLIHGLLRELGLERLAHHGDLHDAVRNRHARHFLGRFVDATQRHGVDAPEVVAVMEPDRGNLRAAWRHAVAQGPAPLVVETAPLLAGYTYAQGPLEDGIQFCADALVVLDRIDAAADGAPPAFAELAEGAQRAEGRDVGSTAVDRGDLDADDSVGATTSGDDALRGADTADTRAARAAIFAARGWLDHRAGRQDEARRAVERALALVHLDGVQHFADGEADIESAASEPGARIYLQAAASTALRLRAVLQRLDGATEEATRDLEAALVCARAANDERLAAEAAYLLAGMPFYHGDAAAARDASTAVLNDIAGRDYLRLECAIHYSLTVFHDHLGDLAAATESATRCEDAARRADYRLGRMNGTLAVGAMHARAGRLSAADERIRDAVLLATELGHRPAERNAREAAATLALERGRPAEAEHHVRRALTSSREDGHRRDEANALRGLVSIGLATHAAEPARAHAQEARTIFEQLGEAAGVAAIDGLIARADLALGEMERGRAGLEAAIAELGRLGEALDRLAATLALTATLAVEGDAHDGLSRIDVLLAELDETGRVMLAPRALTVRGRLVARDARETGNAGVAQRDFSAAIEGFRRHEQAHLCVEPLAALARLHVDRGDGDTARTTALEALELAEQYRLLDTADPGATVADLNAVLRSVDPARAADVHVRLASLSTIAKEEST